MGTSPLAIALIEDDEVDAEAIARCLLRLDDPPHLTVFQTAEAALRAFQRQPANGPTYPFLVLLDLSLPGMPGLELLKRIRQDTSLRNIVVFVLTDTCDHSAIRAAYDLAAAGCMLKSGLRHDYSPVARLVRLYERYVQFPS